MTSAMYSTLIGVLAGGLLSLLIFQFRAITGSLNRLTDQLQALDDKFMAHLTDLRKEVHDGFADFRKEVHDGFRDHGERLARIEVKLDDDPPAETA